VGIWVVRCAERRIGGRSHSAFRTPEMRAPM
jgi:hypothetical protein